MKQWIKYIIILIFVTVTGISSVDAYAASTVKDDTKEETVIVKDNLVITIKIGFSGEARYARYVSAQVDVYNKGVQFDGTVEFTLLNQNQDNISYGKEVELGARSKTTVTVMLPMNKATQSVNFKIVDQNFKTVVEEEIPINIKNYGDYCVIGLLSDQSLSLSYIEYFGNKIIELDSSNLSGDYLTYDMFDVIVVDRFDLDTLGPERLKALLDFVSHGGNLVIGAGDDYQSNVELLQQYNVLWLREPVGYSSEEVISMPITLSSEAGFTTLLTEIKNYEANRTQLLNEMEEVKVTNSLKTSIGTADLNIYVGKSMLGNRSITDISMEYATKEVTKFRVQNPMNQIEYGGIPLFETVSYGDGVVMLFHFCLGNNEITQEKLKLYDGCTDELFSSFYADVVLHIVDNLSDATKTKLNREIYADTLDYRIRELSDYQEMDEVPKVSGFIVILAIYLIVIGPLTFFVLWKRNQQRRIWIIVPCFSILFFLLVLLIGKTTRVEQPYSGYLNLEIYDNQLKEVKGKVFSYIGLHKNGPITIELDTTDPIVIGDNEFVNYYANLYSQDQEIKERFYDYKNEDISVLYKEDGTLLTFNNQSAFSKELVLADYQKEYEALIEGNLTMTKTALNGTLTNVSDHVFHHAFIYLNGYYVDLGTLTPGQTVEVSDYTAVYSSSIDSLFYTENEISKKFVADITSLTPSEHRLFNAYSYLFKNYLLGQEKVMFFATCDEMTEASPLYQLSKEDESYGESIVMSEVDFNTRTEEGVLIPNLDEFLQNSNTYAWDPETRYAYMNTMDFEYQLPNNLEIKEIYLSDLFNQFESNTLSLGGCNRIYFYNFTTQTYELVFDLDSEYGTRSIQGEEIKRFISEDQRVVIRFENRNSSQSIFEVPVISCVKEDNNA